MLLVTSLCGVVLADGIPVNRETRRVSVPHTVIKLSTSQSEEIETLGTLTLSPDQWRHLRTIGRSCPKRIQNILPVTWADCTCDLSPYGIQLSRGEVAITHSQISDVVPADLEVEIEQGSGIWLRVDSRGQFYHNGVLVPFPHLVRLIAASAGKIPQGSASQERYMGIELPVNLRRDSDVLKTRLDTLNQTAKSAGWKTQENDR